MRTRGTALAVLAVACLGACTRSQRQDTSPAASSSTDAVAPAPVPLDAKMTGWEHGRRYRYQMSMASQIGLGDKSPLYDFDLSGTAVLTVLNTSAETAAFYLSVEGGKFVSRVPGSQPEFDKVTSELSRPYFFEMRGGLVTAAHLPGDMHPLAAAAFRTISASFQFARSQRPEHPYTAAEYDTTGQYVAEYEPSGDKRSWRKRKQRYLGILLAKNQPKEAQQISPNITSSQGDVRLFPDGRLDRATQRDELVLTNAQAPLRSKTYVSLSASSVEADSLSVTELTALHQGTVPVAVDEPFLSRMPQPNLDDAKINGWTYERLLTEFKQIAERNRLDRADKNADPAVRRELLKKRAGEESKLFVALGATFRAQPQTIDKALKEIQAKSLVSEVLVDGLGSANSLDAHKALLKLAADKSNDKFLRTRAILSLSRTDNPTPEAAQGLLSFIADERLGTQALYGLGSYVRLFTTAGNKEAASKLGDLLVLRLSRARSEMKLIECLRAIANSAYEPAFATIRPLLSDPRPQIRGDAVAAVAGMNVPEVDRILVEKLSTDPAKNVRLAAVEAMSERTPNDVLIAGLRENSVADDPHVRYRAVETMIRWMPKRMELRESLQAVAKNDDEQKIRELAKAAL